MFVELANLDLTKEGSIMETTTSSDEVIKRSSIDLTQEEILSPYVGQTVLELIANMEQIDPTVSGPRPTPPVPMNTTTRSGQGAAQIADDNMTDHMYE